jgi:hypothetical protein
MKYQIINKTKKEVIYTNYSHPERLVSKNDIWYFHADKDKHELNIKYVLRGYKIRIV